MPHCCRPFQSLLHLSHRTHCCIRRLTSSSDVVSCLPPSSSSRRGVASSACGDRPGHADGELKSSKTVEATPSPSSSSSSSGGDRLLFSCDIVTTLDSFSPGKLSGYIRKLMGRNYAATTVAISTLYPSGDGSSATHPPTWKADVDAHYARQVSGPRPFAPSTVMYLGTLTVPLPEGFYEHESSVPDGMDKVGVLTAQGIASTAKDAELAATMHAIRLLDSLAIPLYSGEKLQRLHVKQRAMLGRWATTIQPLPKAATPTPTGGSGGQTSDWRSGGQKTDTAGATTSSSPDHRFLPTTGLPFPVVYLKPKNPAELQAWKAGGLLLRASFSTSPQAVPTLNSPPAMNDTTKQHSSPPTFPSSRSSPLPSATAGVGTPAPTQKPVVEPPSRATTNKAASNRTFVPTPLFGSPLTIPKPSEEVHKMGEMNRTQRIRYLRKESKKSYTPAHGTYDESEGGEYDLVNVVTNRVPIYEHTLHIPSILDRRSMERVDSYLKLAPSAFPSSAGGKAGATGGGGEGTMPNPDYSTFEDAVVVDRCEDADAGAVMYVATLTFNVMKQQQRGATVSRGQAAESTSGDDPSVAVMAAADVLARGKATSLDVALALCGMHAEVLIDFYGGTLHWATTPPEEESREGGGDRHSAAGTSSTATALQDLHVEAVLAAGRCFAGKCAADEWLHESLMEGVADGHNNNNNILKKDANQKVSYRFAATAAAPKPLKELSPTLNEHYYKSRRVADYSATEQYVLAHNKGWGVLDSLSSLHPNSLVWDTTSTTTNPKRSSVDVDAFPSRGNVFQHLGFCSRDEVHTLFRDVLRRLHTERLRQCVSVLREATLQQMASATDRQGMSTAAGQHDQQEEPQESNLIDMTDVGIVANGFFLLSDVSQQFRATCVVPLPVGKTERRMPGHKPLANPTSYFELVVLGVGSTPEVAIDACHLNAFDFFALYGIPLWPAAGADECQKFAQEQRRYDMKRRMLGLLPTSSSQFARWADPLRTKLSSLALRQQSDSEKDESQTVQKSGDDDDGCGGAAVEGESSAQCTSGPEEGPVLLSRHSVWQLCPAAFNPHGPGGWPFPPPTLEELAARLTPSLVPVAQPLSSDHGGRSTRAPSSTAQSLGSMMVAVSEKDLDAIVTEPLRNAVHNFLRTYAFPFHSRLAGTALGLSSLSSSAAAGGCSSGGGGGGGSKTGQQQQHLFPMHSTVQKAGNWSHRSTAWMHVAVPITRRPPSPPSMDVNLAGKEASQFHSKHKDPRTQQRLTTSDDYIVITAMGRALRRKHAEKLCLLHFLLQLVLQHNLTLFPTASGIGTATSSATTTKRLAKPSPTRSSSVATATASSTSNTPFSQNQEKHDALANALRGLSSNFPFQRSTAMMMGKNRTNTSSSSVPLDINTPSRYVLPDTDDGDDGNAAAAGGYGQARNLLVPSLRDGWMAQLVPMMERKEPCGGTNWRIDNPDSSVMHPLELSAELFFPHPDGLIAAGGVAGGVAGEGFPPLIDAELRRFLQSKCRKNHFDEELV